MPPPGLCPPTPRVGRPVASQRVRVRRRVHDLLQLLDPGRLEALGYGETKPIETNNTTAGRAVNRRWHARHDGSAQPAAALAPIGELLKNSTSVSRGS